MSGLVPPPECESGGFISWIYSLLTNVRKTAPGMRIVNADDRIVGLSPAFLRGSLRVGFAPYKWTFAVSATETEARRSFSYTADVRFPDPNVGSADREDARVRAVRMGPAYAETSICMCVYSRGY